MSETYGKSFSHLTFEQIEALTPAQKEVLHLNDEIFDLFEGFNAKLKDCNTLNDLQDLFHKYVGKSHDMKDGLFYATAKHLDDYQGPELAKNVLGAAFEDLNRKAQVSYFGRLLAIAKYQKEAGVSLEAPADKEAKAKDSTKWN